MEKVIKQSLEFYLNLKYTVSVYQEETGMYSVMIPELPGCMSQGKTIEESFMNLEKARRYWITRAWDSGTVIPLPSDLIENLVRP